MTTTQPSTNQDLQSTSTEDHMEMATSPYAQFDDIDFELDDNPEQFAENDGMVEEKLNTEAKEYSMEDGSLDDNAVEYEADFMMDPDEDTGGNADNLDYLPVEEELIDQHSNTNLSAPSVKSPMAEQVEKSDKPDTFVEGDEFSFEEEEFTNHDTSNTLSHIETNTTDPAKYEPNQHAQTENHSTTLTNTNNDESNTEVVDFATEKSNTLAPKPDHTAITPEKNTTPRNEDQNGAAIDDSSHLINVGDPGSEATGKSTSPHQQPEIVPDESDSDPGAPNSPYQHSAARHLHPVTLRYQDQDMSLFPPLEEDDSATYFLGDPSLAFEPFDKTLSACRDLLGESIGHDDEMVIDIPSLGLHICEDSKYATQLTLAQVIDTYMLLSQNENLSPIKPLHCELTHRVCLSTQMAYLANSAREGKTYSAIVSEHMDMPEFEDSAVEEYAETSAYQDELDEVNGSEESDNVATVDATHDFAPAAAIDNPQTFHEETEHSHDAAKVTSPPKVETDQGVSEEKPSASFAAVDSASKKPELASDQNGITESQSSHSLERDQDGLTELEAGTFDPEEAELSEGDEIDFALAEDDLDGNNAADLDRLTSTEQSDIPQTSEERSNDHLKSKAEITSDNVDILDDIADGPVSSGALLATPSKNNSKRKLVDDDDFLEIDISTPEPKRRRPS